MHESDQVQRQIQRVLGELQYLTRLLAVVRDPYTRNLALQQQWSLISFLEFLIGQVTPEQAPTLAAPAPPVSSPQARPGLPAISREQLAAATGRNGNPAYVAVDGTVYDVTENKAWSNATHFGLPAGRDLTAEFASCHAAQQWILGTLKPVGRLG